MKVIQQIIISQLPSPFRLNQYCETFIDYFQSKKSVKKAISKGEVHLNGNVPHGGTWLKNGDKITILDLEKTPPKTYHLIVPVVYEDAHLAIMNKPAGLIVSGNQFKTLANTLMYNLKPSTELHALAWPLPVHRLDSQTSGLILVAKTKSARIQLGRMFEDGLIEKTYHAIVMGQLENKGIFNMSIEEKTARTNYTVLKSVKSLKNDWLSLVELNPKTGRTHQLRIHLSQNGNPILGDKLYAENTLKQKGLFLNASVLEFTHPITNKKLNISIPLPPKFNTRLNNEQRRWDKYNTNFILN